MPASERKASAPKTQTGIFISYRRSDTPDAVGRIYDRLVSEFGKSRVFKDVDSIPLGQDFRGHLNDVVGGCSAVLAIIGPRWVDARSESGLRRLEDPDDFVRIELEAALARKVPVVPVQVGHAQMPAGGQLPESLMSLIYRQAIEVRPDPDFHNDATRLVSALRLILDPNARVGAAPNQAFKWLIAFSAGAVIAAAALAFPAWKHLRQPQATEMRPDIVTPATDRPFDFALSPDGRQIVFVAKGDGASRLWLRTLAAETAQPLTGTEGATAPFWSPDGRSIGFFAGSSMKRIDLDGGQPRILAPVRTIGGGTWSSDNVILYAGGPADPLMRISATGGNSTVVTKVGPLGASHRAPLFLPDDQFLFVSLAGTANGIYLGSLDGGTPVRLTNETSVPAYLPSGWMMWIRNGALVAQRLDLQKSALTGQLVTLAAGVGSLSVSNTGLVAYRPASARKLQLRWIDRSGATLGTIGDQDDTLVAPRVAPDGRRVAVSRTAQNNIDLWLLDGARASRMTFDETPDFFSSWSPDGARLVFTSLKSSGGNLYEKLTSGAGADTLLLASDQPKYPSSWSADGRHLLYFSVDPKEGADLWVLPMTGDRKPFVLLKTPSMELWGSFSPDGRWVAYQSSESGRDQVYVRPFVQTGSNVAAGQWQVSTDGGVHPVWRADGKELFYINPSGEMMAVPISATDSTVVPGTPLPLFKTQIMGGGIDYTQGRQYDVSADGRFLINTELDTGSSAPITLIQNWNPDAGK